MMIKYQAQKLHFKNQSLFNWHVQVKALTMAAFQLDHVVKKFPERSFKTSTQGSITMLGSEVDN